MNWSKIERQLMIFLEINQLIFKTEQQHELLKTKWCSFCQKQVSSKCVYL